MITIERLRLLNWKPFRGEHILDLEAKPYAVFAREAGNAERSNALGKSSLVEAVDFALYGRLADEFKARKRGWISRGEKSGEVDLSLSDGSRIVRSQSLSGSERLWYFPPGAPDKGAVQAAAQQRIDELVGLSRDDFAATRYFRQGEMARLITLDPGPRLDLVAGWLRLGPLQECEDESSGVLRDIARRRDAASAEARAAEDAEVAEYRRAGLEDAFALGSGPRDLELAVAYEVGRQVTAQAAIDASQEALAKDAEREGARAAAEAYERVVADGTRIGAEVGGLVAGAGLAQVGGKLDRATIEAALVVLRGRVSETDEASRSALNTAGLAKEESRAKVALVTGQFDGRCPLLGEECPAREHVERRGRTMHAEDRKANDAYLQARDVSAAADGARREAARRLEDLESKARRLGELRAEAARLKPAHERWQALSEHAGETAASRAALEQGRAELRSAQEREAVLRGCERGVEASRERAAAARGEAERLERSVRVAAAAVAIFGRGGAQRRMAEDALTEIQDRACEMLAGTGITLSVEVRWSREGSGVAATCAACGEPFPRSEKVKACARCCADRGPLIINRLEIEPSAQSGGARDLCGIFVQLAAAEWLVADRESRWGTAMLDEPTASLDADRRRALASHLPAILRESGCSQALVIAHTREILGSLPGQIEVLSEGGWSKARVV